jgi:MFS superfamily sulfate permease-like transporter
MMWERLKLFVNPIDGRYEDLRKGSWQLTVLRDFTAGLIVALVAIPLAMGLASASGLHPVHGIVGGAVAGLVGALFGGSKYQVYGPTAAFIPVIGGVMVAYGAPFNEDPELYAQGLAFLVLASLVAGAVLMLLGLLGLGRVVALVPHSIVVGFTIGIAVTIALSQVGELLGLKAKLPYQFLDKVPAIVSHLYEFQLAALLLGLGTFVLTKYLLKLSLYIPAPLLTVGLGTAISSLFLVDAAGQPYLTLVQSRYGSIPTNLLAFTAPALPDFHLGVLYDLVRFSLAIVFVSGVESLLCSRMADRLADNRGTPFNPNKELWGQGLVNVIVPLLNGFPHTGALARTATNIKVGAVTPLAGIFKCFLKLLLAAGLAAYLEQIPMACLAGILLYVAMNMVKPAEVKQVLAHNRFHIGLMVFTAVMVIVTDFLIGVLSAIILYAVLCKFLDRPAPEEPRHSPLSPPDRLIETDGRLPGRDGLPVGRDVATHHKAAS